MAPKNLVSGKRRVKQHDKRNHSHPDEERSGQPTGSDSAGEAAGKVAAPVVPPKKPKSIVPPKMSGPEPVENGSACSSPSASGFLIVPSQKPSGEKKASAAKVFSNEDVIAMLKGLAVFWSNGRNNKWAEFHLFIKDELRNQFTKVQVSEKIRSLKKKFDANLERAQANGGVLDLSDPHETAVFELSKALWLGDENGVALKKAEMAENEGKEENEIKREKKKVNENDEGSKSRKKREQMDENGEGSKKMKKRKQLNEHGEDTKATRKLEHEIEESLGGDERDAANTILSMKLVNGDDEGSKKMKKRKHVDEHDEKKELLKEGIQVDEHDEANKIPSKQKRVDERGEGKKKKKKRKQADELDKAINAVEQKEANEDVEKREIVKEVCQGDGDDEKEQMLDGGECSDDLEKQGVTTRKPKHVDSNEVKKNLFKLGKQEDDLVKLGKQEDDHHEENNIPANHEQEMEIRAEHFQFAYPLLYASFDIFNCPRVVKENCALIGRENAQQLEEKWRELNAEMHRIELKKLDLMKRDSDRLQGK